MLLFTCLVKHNLLLSLPFEFAAYSKWFKNSLKLTIIHFFRFTIHEAINESCHAGLFNTLNKKGLNSGSMFSFTIVIFCINWSHSAECWMLSGLL